MEKQADCPYTKLLTTDEYNLGIIETVMKQSERRGHYFHNDNSASEKIHVTFSWLCFTARKLAY